MTLPHSIVMAEEPQRSYSEMDQSLMSRALELAARGAGLVSPGPLVGCVIAGADGEVVGEGFYRYEQIKHAETYALEQAGERARGASAYVSLEPHAHYGRTPPCSDALIRAGIKRVVAPIEDPNPKVSGKGFAHLRAAGVEVSVGLKADAASQLNEKYLHFMQTGRPFVHLKLAVSLDGKIATRSGDSKWITGEEARQRSQELRHEYDAIMVGAGTAVKDQPSLTDRSGLPRRLPLVRVLLDEGLRVLDQSQLVTSAHDAPLLVICGTGAETSKIDALTTAGVEVLTMPNGPRDLASVLEELGRREIQSVIVEGGSNVAGSFIDAGLVNKISFFIAPKIIGGCGAPAAIGGLGAELLTDAVELKDVKFVARGNDIEVTGYPSRQSKK